MTRPERVSRASARDIYFRGTPSFSEAVYKLRYSKTFLGPFLSDSSTKRAQRLTLGPNDFSPYRAIFSDHYFIRSAFTLDMNLSRLVTSPNPWFHFTQKHLLPLMTFSETNFFCCSVLCKQQATFRLRDRTIQLLSSLKPLFNDCFHIGKSLLMRFPICCTSGQLRNLSDKCLVFFAPINNYFIFDHLQILGWETL